jgi:hypothetical protein
MPLSSWIRSLQKTSQSSRRQNRAAARSRPLAFRPQLQLLEARELLSASPVSIAATGAVMGNGTSVAAANALSADGVYEVFASGAKNLTSDITVDNYGSDVYRRNLSTGVTSLVNVNAAGTAVSSNQAIQPAISPDGRYVVFVSSSRDLTNNDATVSSAQVYVRDMQLSQTFMVTLNRAGTNGGNSDSLTPVVSDASGILAVAYASRATDLTTGDNSVKQQIFASTLQLNAAGAIQYNTLATVLISSDPGGNGGNFDSGAPLLSKDASTVGFTSQATNLNIPGGYNANTIATNFYVYTLANSTLKVLSVEPTTTTAATGSQMSFLAQAPLSNAGNTQSISSNGQYAIFMSASDNLVPGVLTFNMTNVYRRDLVNGTTSLVSIDPTNTQGVNGGDFAREAVISADGRYVAFSSDSDNLVSGATGGVYVRDMQQGQTYFVSLGIDNVSANASNPSIGVSAGKLVVAYNSNATNLTAGDTVSNHPQVFVTSFELDGSGNIQANTRTTTLASADSTGNGGDGDSSPPVISADGSTVGFTTRAQNLVGETPDSANNFNHIQLFTYKVGAGTLTQVSPAAPPGGTVDATNLLSISANGQFLTYDFVVVTPTSNTGFIYGWNGTTNIQIYTSTGATFPIVGAPVVSADGSTIAFLAGNVYAFSANYVAANWQSGTPSLTQIGVSPAGLPDSISAPMISGDGKVVAYTYEPDAATPFQLYIYANGAAFAAGPATNGDAGTPVVSADGSTVIFNSVADNVVPGVLDFNKRSPNLYSYNVSAKAISLLSAKAPGLFTIDNNTLSASISDDGRYVAFFTGANDMFGGLDPFAASVVAEDIQLGKATQVAAVVGQLTATVLSGDGTTVAFSTNVVLTSIPISGVQLYSSNWLAASPAYTLLSVNSQGTGGANDNIVNPTISDNGQVVAFASVANNLTSIPNSTNHYQIFVRNQANQTTTMASANSGGTDGGNDNSLSAFVSADGSVVTFNSPATDLVANVSASGGFTNVFADLITSHAGGLVVAAGSGQSATVSTTFGAPLVATVTDQFGNPLGGIVVTFTGPGSGAGASFPGGNTATTNSQGQATLMVAANGSAGSYTVMASAPGVATAASFSLTNTAAPTSTISGTVFSDFNLNGQQDGGEPGLASQTVFLDLNDNGVLDSNEPSVVTGGTGAYSFPGLAAETYTIRQVLFGGVILDNPASGSYTVTFSGGANVANENFANVLTNIAAPLTVPPNTPFPSHGNPSANYVEALFRALLLRNADQAGLTFWSGQLASGAATRVQVMQGIRQSTERFKGEVNDFYLTLLHRAADATGQDFWVGQLANGTREEQIAANFLNSPEYLSQGDKFFVDSMYESLLGRKFEPDGEQFWLAQLAGNPAVSHSQVVSDFLFSKESLQRLVAGYYPIYLQRPADQQGLDAWVTQLQQGLPFVTIGEQFLASDEFYNNAVSKG